MLSDDEIKLLCGWTPPHERNTEQNEAHERIMASLPPFPVEALYRDEPGARIELWRATEKVLGRKPKFNNQTTGSCFPAGTPVRMANGSEKPVEAVVVGDEVVSHTGATRRVVETMRRPFTGEMVSVRLSGYPFPLEMTDDHKVAVWREESRWAREKGRLKWVSSRNLQVGDRLILSLPRASDQERPTLDVATVLGQKAIVLDDLMEKGEAPVSNVGMAQWVCRKSGIDWRGRVKVVRSAYENSLPRYVRVTPSFARLMGLYLAEGGTDGCRTVFSLGAHEESLADEIIDLLAGIFGVEAAKEYSPDRPNNLKVRVDNLNLAEFLRSFCSGDVWSKRVPGIFLRCDDEVRLSLLMGWLAGDGYKAVKKSPGKVPGLRVQGTTASPLLARDMNAIALACGLRASVSRRKPRKQSGIAYDVYLGGKKTAALFPILAAQAVAAGAKLNRERDSNRCPYGYLRRVVEVTHREVETLPVFDFEVEEDHSFVAGDIVVHNCVGAGGGNALKVLQCVEIAAGDLEEYRELWWPYTYGRSRFRAGMRTPGEGSTGSGWAEAVTKDGSLAQDEKPGLPQFEDADGWLRLSQSIERSWSDGDAQQSLECADIAKTHLVKTAAAIKSSAEAQAALQNGYSLTLASMFGTRGPRLQGEPQVQLAAWDGSWAHQMSSHSFWAHPTLGPIFYIQNNWGSCYDDQTEVLTDKGWRKFTELPEDVRVATLNPGTHELEYQAPTARMVFDYLGPLVSFRSRHIDQLVTPNHNVYVTQRKSDGTPERWKLVEAERCSGDVQMKKDAYCTSPDREFYEVAGYRIPMDDWLEFLGYYVSEGYCDTGVAKPRKRKRMRKEFVRQRNGEPQALQCPETWVANRQTYAVYIAQVKPEGRAKIQPLLDRLPFHFSPTEDQWVCHCKELWQEVRALGNYAPNKRLPDYFRELSFAQARVLLSALMVGDGTVKELQQVYFTSSRQLADDVQELLLRAGFSGDIGVTDRRGRTNERGTTRELEYRIGINRFHNETGPAGGFPKVLIPYDGKVYCLTVPNHLLYVRRNGKACWSGNSAHPKPAQGEPEGGFWVNASTMDRICKSEVFALSFYAGFPSRSIPWLFT